MNEAIMIAVIALYLLMSIIKRFKKKAMNIEPLAYPPEGNGVLFCEKNYYHRISLRGILGTVIELCLEGVFKIQNDNGRTDILKTGEYTGKDDYKKRIIDIFFDKNNEVVYSEDAIVGYPVYHLDKMKLKNDTKELLKEINVRKNKPVSFIPPSHYDLRKWEIVTVIFIMVIVWLGSEYVSAQSFFGVMFISVFVYIGIRMMIEGIAKQMINSILFSSVWLTMVFSMIFNLLKSGSSMPFLIIAIISSVLSYILHCVGNSRNQEPSERLVMSGFIKLLESGREYDKINLKYTQNNPSRFYEVLPYVFALGKHQKWMDVHKDILIVKPDWIICEGEADYKALNQCLDAMLYYTK